MSDKSIIALVLAVWTILALWFGIIGGAAQAIDAIKMTPVNQVSLALGLLRFFLSGPLAFIGVLGTLFIISKFTE